MCRESWLIYFSQLSRASFRFHIDWQQFVVAPTVICNFVLVLVFVKVLNVLSSFAIILLRKREQVALLLTMISCCCVLACLFLMVLWVGLWLPHFLVILSFFVSQSTGVGGGLYILHLSIEILKT